MTRNQAIVELLAAMERVSVCVNALAGAPQHKDQQEGPKGTQQQLGLPAAQQTGYEEGES